MIPRHPPRALSSLTYINFHTRLKYQRVVTFPYSIGNVRRPAEPPSPHVRAKSLRTPADGRPLESMLLASPPDVGRPPLFLLVIAACAGQRNRPDFPGRTQSVIRGRFAIQLRGSRSSSAALFASLYARFPLSLVPPQCTPADSIPAREMVEPRRLELLTPSLQRRCSPN